MGDGFVSGVISGVLGIVVFVSLVAIVATPSQREVERREAECKRQLASATASDSLRVYRLQPKCMEANR